MPDILKKTFPYNSQDYRSRFINVDVIEAIHDFCTKEKNIDSIYAKGSLIYGCMIKGSDIDHVRIKVRQKLSLDEKVRLVDSFEDDIKKTGVSVVRRLREDGYVRVFFDWEELIKFPKAYTKNHEVYPNPRLIVATNKEDWLEKVLAAGIFESDDPLKLARWIEKMTLRISKD